MTSRRPGPTLAGLRRTYLAFVAALAAYGLVLAFLVPFGDAEALTDPIYLLVPVAFLIGQVVRVLVSRLTMTVPSDDRSAVGRFVTRFFIGVATAELPILVGFASAFFEGGGQIRYWAAVALGVIPFVLAAPSDRMLDGFQAQLTDAGSPVDIRAALG